MPKSNKINKFWERNKHIYKHKMKKMKDSKIRSTDSFFHELINLLMIVPIVVLLRFFFKKKYTLKLNCTYYYYYQLNEMYTCIHQNI